MSRKLGYAIIASLLIHCLTIAIFPHLKPHAPPIEESVTKIKLIGTIPSYAIESDYISKLKNLAKETSMNMQGKRENALFNKIKNAAPLIKLPPKKHLTQNPKDILPMDIPYRRPDHDMKENTQIGDGIKNIKVSNDRLRFDSLLQGEGSKSKSAVLPFDTKIEQIKRKKKLSFIGDKNIIEDLPDEEKISDLKIEWEGTPRALLYSPEVKASYQGEIEGKIQLRFWVDKSGYVIKAVSLKKLSPKLEETALNYIVYNRFEASDKYEIQEGIITINFMLN